MADDKEEYTLPALSDIIPARFPVPAALATTIPEVTSIITPGALTTVTVPENSRIVVPVLPECIPLIARVPDVVCTVPPRPLASGDHQEVKISQVLPGYAPSYAGDYMPEQVNSHSFNNFVNTMSFNVSRYPTLSEVTSSKDYSKDAKKSKLMASAQNLPNTTNQTHQKMDYKPAEYFTGPASQQFQPAGVVMSQSIRMVPPDVLSSGRVMTNMSHNAMNFYTEGNEGEEDQSSIPESTDGSSPSTPTATTTAVANEVPLSQ